MNKKLLRLLLGAETIKAMKKGRSFKDAIEYATNKVKKDMEKAEFEAYCSEHNC